MFRLSTVCSIPLFLILASAAVAQSQPASDPQALAFAAHAIAAITGGTSISDVTLTGTATWNASSSQTGTATLRALGTSESRIDLVLTSGTRTEIRDAQTGPQVGQWINPDNSSGQFAAQNCWTDAVWFFPALGSLAVGPNVVLSYIGQETRNSETVQHIQSYIYDPNWPAGVTPTDKQMSTMDFYLDATTFLPSAVRYNGHPDNSTSTNLPVEVDFSNYQNVGGFSVAMIIQKYSQGSLLMDVTVSSATFNTGLPLSLFAINH